jgi:hypothetical protein
MLCCAVLCCAVLCCAVLYCGVVWCGVVWSGELLGLFVQKQKYRKSRNQHEYSFVCGKGVCVCCGCFYTSRILGSPHALCCAVAAVDGLAERAATEAKAKAKAQGLNVAAAASASASASADSKAPAKADAKAKDGKGSKQKGGAAAAASTAAAPAPADAKAAASTATAAAAADSKAPPLFVNGGRSAVDDTTAEVVDSIVFAAVQKALEYVAVTPFLSLCLIGCEQ